MLLLGVSHHLQIVFITGWTPQTNVLLSGILLSVKMRLRAHLEHLSISVSQVYPLMRDIVYQMFW
jgi:hypothetical protein